MLKQKFVFAVSLIAMVTVGIGAARADIASTVYVQQGVDSAKTAASAAQTSANKANTAAVNAQGSADTAQAAAEAAQVSADNAAASAKTANDTVATKFSKTSSVTNAIVTTDGSGNVAPVAIVDDGSGTYVTDVTVSAGKVTLSRGTPASYSLPTASSTTKGGVKIGANVNVATDGTISVAAPGNATLTIQRNGADVGTFTANASSNKTINITDNDTIYTLPAASSTTLGGVKIGSNITNSSGTISVTTTATPTSGSGVPLTSGGAYTALSGKQATLSAAQLSAANSGITLAKVSTYDGYATQISAKEASANKVSSTADAERVGTDTAFPTVSLVNSLISTANNELGAELSQKQATLTTTNVTTTGSGNVVTAVSAANGVVTVTKGTSLGTLATKSAISSADITDASIGAVDLGTAVVTLAKMADDSVNSAKIVNGSVATVDIADGAVTTAKISDGAVTSAKLAADAVTSAKISDGTVALADLAANSVNSAKIVDLSIATGDIANGAVTAAKTSGVIGSIPSGSATSTTYASIWVE